MLAKVIQRIGSWGLVGIAALFGLFAAGYAFEDPGGWAAVGMVVSFLAPTGLFGAIAWRWPHRAGVTVVPFVVAITLVWILLPVFPDELREWFDRVGPVFAMTTTVAAVVLAILGLRRPVLAGGLLIGIALFIFTQLVLAADALHEGPGPWGLLGTSGGVMLRPMAVAGALLLAGHWLEQHERPAAAHRAHPAHA